MTSFRTIALVATLILVAPTLAMARGGGGHSGGTVVTGSGNGTGNTINIANSGNGTGNTVHVHVTRHVTGSGNGKINH